MSTDLLTLMQWLSPSFPVGAFAYSHGLETAIADERLKTADDLAIWLADILCSGGGQSDLVILARAYHAEGTAVVDATAQAFAPSADRLTETCDQGTAFARTVREVWDIEVAAQTYPVAVGRAAALCGIPCQSVALAYAHAFCANLISAAVRLVPLGQTEGQQVLSGLTEQIERAAALALSEKAPLYSNCIASDIAAMRHETLYSKVFRT